MLNYVKLWNSLSRDFNGRNERQTNIMLLSKQKFQLIYFLEHPSIGKSKGMVV